MGKKGNGSRGGPPNRGRGGGRGRGRGRGGGGGFQPFGGQGHVLGGASGSASPSGYNSPRGGAANGRPFRGRGRGGHLSVSGQNRAGFDYGSFSRGNRRDYDDDDEDDEDEDEEDDEEDAADFAIEPPKGYKHKVKPHLESDVVSDPEDNSAKPQAPHQLNIPSGSTTPQRVFNASSIVASAVKPRFTPRSTAPTNFPEFFTSRGAAGGGKYRPPEETEDSRYLAGVPGLRRPERKQRNAPRFGDPADSAQSPFRVPVAFVKATGEFGDPLKGNLPPTDPNDASIDPAAPMQQLTEAQQQQPPPGDQSAPRHAGLGFSNRSNVKPAVPGSADAAAQKAAQQTATPYQPSRAAPVFPDTTVNAFNFDGLDAIDGENDDEVNALLAAFPGSKELAPGESMIEDDASLTWSMPAFQPEARAVPSNLAEAPKNGSSNGYNLQDQKAAPSTQYATAKPASRSSISSSSDDEEIILVPSQSQTHTEHASIKEQVTVVENVRQPALDSVAEMEVESKVEVTEETDFGFVIDLEGEDPDAAAERTNAGAPTTSSHRMALGDAVATSSKAPRKKQSAKRGKPARIPREGDSDLDWGSDGPPGDSGDDDDVVEADNLAAATAGIHITRSNNDETITDPILLKAIRADRHEWESEDDGDIVMEAAKNKRRGGQRAKRSLANRNATSRNNARSRKADQEAIVADYMQNILDQGADTSDEDAAKDDLFSTDDMVVETVDGGLPSEAAGKGKAAARRLSNKLDDKTDMDAMIRFMNGMDPQKGGRQLGFGDIEDEIHMDEVKEWLTESEDDSDEDGDGDGVQVVDVNAEAAASKKSAKPEAAGDDEEDEDLAEQLRIILEADDDDESSEVFSEDSESSEEEDDDDDDEDVSDSDDDDDDEGMFRGKYSWADEDEDFIRALSSQVGGAGIGSRSGSAPSSKRAQKKLFHAISNGDFSDLMDLAADENEIDSDDPAYGMGSIPTARNGKRKGRKFTSDDLWAEELQQQWDKDRAGKASKKQQRLAERQAAALNPFPNTHGAAGSAGKTKSTKKQLKLARKAEKREARASLKAHSNNVVSAIKAAGSLDAVDASVLTFGGQSASGDITSLGLDKRFAFNMDELNQQIQHFLSERGRNTMRCQPMDKFARAEVHALAAAYNLQSKSKGKGRDRFPTLIKTSKSGLNVDYRKVKRIVYSNAGATFGNDAGRSDFKDKGRNKKGKGGGQAGGMYGVGGGTVPKNREGEEVGFGADKIGADNIGHKLLAAMGWTEGKGIGSSQGMANPVSATVKTSRGGLGF
ncbi:G-patch domain protein [Kalmanozyma brasiliensis GHG001]|uniref:Protein SQS1 n=1 Tax=Kalmanozyma brasiliensis (strain GHG001) TaxID=1365824 RepID=V5GW74_KALBG|nr:G-patch domain protein [Kalmanozyma brasiliensis GHG001]EST10137.1 G-patch domain protein [Kalmanozyma brasiliensis GHG001]